MREVGEKFKNKGKNQTAQAWRLRGIGGKGKEEAGKKRKRRLSDTSANKSKKQPWGVWGNSLAPA